MWSNSKKEEDEGVGEEEEEEGEEDTNPNVEAEEEGDDSSAEMMGPSASAQTPAEEEKSEELKEESVADEEQKADVGDDVQKTGEVTKPPHKKLSVFRRLSFTRSKQTNDRDQASEEGPVSVDAALHREPPSPGSHVNSEPNTNTTASGDRTGRSGACIVL